MRRGSKHPTLEILLSLPFVRRLDCQPRAGQGSPAFLTSPSAPQVSHFPGSSGLCRSLTLSEHQFSEHVLTFGWKQLSPGRREIFTISYQKPPDTKEVFKHQRQKA